jgi:GMP synthase-like glutamine amidotransferase
VLEREHGACELPGVYSEGMGEGGVEAVPVELDAGERPADWRGFDAVLAMGGPMGVGDRGGHPWLTDERRLVREAVEAGRPFLGVCLGVQLLAAALEAEVYAADRPEVGLLEVELTDEGRADPLFAGLADPLVSFQWHGDTFDLPGGAVRLARSDAIPNQAFRWGERAYGVQFHLEVTPEMAQEWATIPAYRESLASTLGPDEGEAFIAEVERRATDLHPPARRLFSNWLELAAVPAQEH